ncbi:hypothetical protein SCA6_007674 [Theobroma cacao]
MNCLELYTFLTLEEAAGDLNMDLMFFINVPAMAELRSDFTYEGCEMTVESQHGLNLKVDDQFARQNQVLLHRINMNVPALSRLFLTYCVNVPIVAVSNIEVAKRAYSTTHVIAVMGLTLLRGWAESSYIVTHGSAQHGQNIILGLHLTINMISILQLKAIIYIANSPTFIYLFIYSPIATELLASTIKLSQWSLSSHAQALSF